MTNYKARSNHYLADMDMAGQPVYSQNDADVRTECLTDLDTVSNNNKENNKEEIKLFTNLHSIDRKANQPMEYFGKYKLVRMTLHQYVNLLRAFGVLPARGYIRELGEEILKHRYPANPDHYQEIISRATEDGLMTDEGREILMN